MRNVLSIITILFATLTFTGVLPACGGSDANDPNEGEAEAESEAESEAETEGEGEHVLSELSATFHCQGQTYEYHFSDDPEECEPCTKICSSSSECEICTRIGEYRCMDFALYPSNFSVSGSRRSDYSFYNSDPGLDRVTVTAIYTRPWAGPGLYNICEVMVGGRGLWATFPEDVGPAYCEDLQRTLRIEGIEGIEGKAVAGNAIQISFHVERMTLHDTSPTPTDCVLDGQAIFPVCSHGDQKEREGVRKGWPCVNMW